MVQKRWRSSDKLLQGTSGVCAVGVCAVQAAICVLKCNNNKRYGDSCTTPQR